MQTARQTAHPFCTIELSRETETSGQYLPMHGDWIVDRRAWYDFFGAKGFAKRGYIFFKVVMFY